MESEAARGGPFVRVPFGEDYPDLAPFLETLAPLTNRHEDIIDLAFAYEAITKTTHREQGGRVGEKDRIICQLGRLVRQKAKSDPLLLDALEDWEDDIGPGIGLVRAITDSKSPKEFARVLAVAARLEAEAEHLNPKHHVLNAVEVIGPSLQDQSLIRRTRSLLEYWEQQENDEDENGRSKDLTFLEKLSRVRQILLR